MNRETKKQKIYNVLVELLRKNTWESANRNNARAVLLDTSEKILKITEEGNRNNSDQNADLASFTSGMIIGSLL